MPLNITEVDAALRLTRQHFRHLGLELPAALTDAFATADHDLGDRAALRFDPAELTAAVADALAAGKDPATDKTVTAHLTRWQLQQTNVAQHLDRLVADRRATVVAEHVDAIIETMRPVVDAADQALADAVDRGLDLDDTQIVGLRPPDAAALAAGRQASEHLTRVVQVWTHLTRATRTVRAPAAQKPRVQAGRG